MIISSEQSIDIDNMFFVLKLCVISTAVAAGLGAPLLFL